ncbi:hypothetical protein M2148_000890 [Lachnospiraceae bacterium PF1-4]
MGKSDRPMRVEFSGENSFMTINCIGNWRDVEDYASYIFSGEGSVNCHNIQIAYKTFFEIESGVYNIETDSSIPSPAYIGISTAADTKYYQRVCIRGGEVNIKNTAPIVPEYEAEHIYVGINIWNGDIIIDNATINIDLGKNSRAYGIVAGVTWDWGFEETSCGGVSIYNSDLNISIQGENAEYALVCKEPQVAENLFCYVGNIEANKRIVADKLFETYPNTSAWKGCSYSKLDIRKLPKDGDIAFVDVRPDDWYYGAVKNVYQRRVMTGLDNNYFGPTEDLVRAQFAALLYKLEGSPSVEYDNRFSDVADGQWYTKPILWAAQNGIVNGYQDGRFGVGDSINREQIATMLYSYSKFKGYDLSQSGDLSVFPDNSKVSVYAKKSLQWAVGVGFISGTNGKLDPQGSAVRAQCAAIMMRYLNAYE